MKLLRRANLVCLGLMMAGCANASVAAAPTAFPSELTDLRAEFPAVRFASWETRHVEVLIPALEDMKNGGAKWLGFRKTGARLSVLCGGWGAVPDVLPRESELSDPVRAITTAYRGCWSVMAEVFESRVRVEHYPEGYFGDLVSEGMLRAEGREIASEVERAALFALLVEAVDVREDEMEYEWPDAATGGMTVRDIRWEVGLVPEAALEFVGAKPLRVEISLKQGRMLLLAGGKWSVYRLDRPMVAALEEFLAPVSEVVE